MIVIDLSKQKILDADPKAIQQINFTGNLARNPVANTTMVFITEKTHQYKMIEYTTLNVKLSSSIHNKLKLWTKNGTYVTNDEKNFHISFY